MPQRTASGYKPAPQGVALMPQVDEDTPLRCPTCGQTGYLGPVDERGLLIVHPGGDWPCRVKAVVGL